MVFIDFDPRYKHFELKRKKTTTERLQEGIDESQRLDKDRKLPFIPQVPVLPSMISMNNPYDVYHGSLVPIGSIYPNEENKPSFPIPREKIPPSVGNHASVVTEPVTPQEQNSKPEPSFWDKLSRFSQSDVSKNIDDFLMGAITASPNSSGWQLFAKGLKNLHEGDKQRGQVNQTVEYLKSKGYSEEEARFMARNPQMLSAMLTGGDTPKLSQGFQWYTNPETGEREMRPVKGSPQELEYNQKLQSQKEWEGRRIKNMFTTKQQLRAGLNDLKAAFELIQTGKATGFKGWFTKKFGGSDGYKLDKLLEGIRGGVLRTVFENLKSMSPSGTVGTGPISNFESQALSSMFGSLDVGRDKEGLERTFEVIKTAFDFFNRHNDLQLYNALTGQPIDTPQEISDKYFVDSPMSQGGGANIPIMKWQEGIDRDDITVFIDASTGKRIEKEEY